MKLNELVNDTTIEELYWYAFRQGKRTPEFEPTIMKSPMWAYYYAKDVIKHRWREAEPHISKEPEWMNEYVYLFPKAWNPSKDVPLTIGRYAITDVPNTITNEQVKKMILLMEPRAINLDNIALNRIYYDDFIEQLINSNRLYQVTSLQLINDDQKRKRFLALIYCYNDSNNDFE